MYNLREKGHIKTMWIGLCSYHPENKKEKQELTQLFEDNDCIPIFISSDLNDDYFNYYENIMKPLFYNFKGLYDDCINPHKYDDWGCYKAVNEKFSEKLIEVKDRMEQDRSNVFIWLNNHQLFLVPQYLRK